MTLRRMCNTDNNDGIGFTRMTDHTFLQYGDLFLHECLWLKRHCFMMNMIENKWPFYIFDFFWIPELIWS